MSASEKKESPSVRIHALNCVFRHDSWFEKNEKYLVTVSNSVVIV